MLVQDRLHVSQHPLLLSRLGPLRDRDTPPVQFRRLVRELAQLLFYEATADLPTQPYTVTTPLAECPAQRLGVRVGLAPILRAGLGMAEAVLELVPEAQVWHLGLYRDHATHQPVMYYNNLPPQPWLDVCYVVDPMLATGGSAVAAVAILKRWGARDVRYLGLIAAPEGVRALQAEHPEVPIYLAALDSNLNDARYIVPGLGDAGDRQFGTFTK